MEVLFDMARMRRSMDDGGRMRYVGVGRVFMFYMLSLEEAHGSLLSFQSHSLFLFFPRLFSRTCIVGW